MKNSFHLLILLPIASAGAGVLRFKDESSYLTHLASEGYNLVTEDFEGLAWDGVRSNYPTLNYAPSVTSQRITWSSAGRDLWTWPGDAALISTWNPGAVSSIDQGDGYELVTAHSSPSPAPQERQFFHLEITKP